MCSSDLGLCDDSSSLRTTLLVKAIKTERWRKWMCGDDVKLQVDDILKNERLSLEILDISGHYAFNDPEVKAEIEKLYKNLGAQDIDGQRFVVEHLGCARTTCAYTRARSSAWCPRVC